MNKTSKNKKTKPVSKKKTINKAKKIEQKANSIDDIGIGKFKDSPADLILMCDSDTFLEKVYETLKHCEDNTSNLEDFQMFIESELPSGILHGIFNILAIEKKAELEKDKEKLAETHRLYNIATLVLSTLYVTWRRLKIHYPEEKV